MDTAMVVAVACSVTGAAGPVIAAVIQVRGRRPRADEPMSAGGGGPLPFARTGAGQAAGRELLPDDGQ